MFLRGNEKVGGEQATQHQVFGDPKTNILKFATRVYQGKHT